MFLHALTGIAAIFAATLAVYGIVRAIGWRVWLALMVPALMLYGLGRGLRYVLSGE